MSRRTSLILAAASLLLTALIAPTAAASVRGALDPASPLVDARPALSLEDLSAQR